MSVLAGAIAPLPDPQWMGAVALATIASVFAATILWMVSKYFELKNLEQNAKAEMVFAASTVILVLFLVLFLNEMEPILESIMNDIAKDAIGASNLPTKDTSMIDLTKALMEPKVACMKKAMATLYIIAIPHEMAASTYIEIFMSEVASGFAVKAVTERITNTTNAITFYTFIYYLFVNILNFVKYTALTILLPAGILMRSFPPTRGAGAYVMAFAIGMYFIFPLSYIVTDLMVLDYSGDWCAIPVLKDNPLSSSGMFDQAKIKEAESWVERNLQSTSLITEFISGKVVKQLTLSICLIPLMALTITLTFVLSSTSLFGGNIPEVGRGLIKLI